ncbi:Hsp20/alpha crystallin family protein [bacterium]|nr:Hsp20/alpha crystallin family protein [bacterium]
MYVPSIFGENLMDEWFNDWDREFFGKKNPLYGRNAKHLMKTDVREHEDCFEIDVEVPGFHKDEIKLTLEDGCLNITAAKGLDREQKDEKSGKIIRQERYSGSLSRSFYVGDALKEEDIKAKLEHGVLRLQLPKKENKPALPEKKTIAIEG